ncbi:3-deoxy-7-phosphoheptulonate synthase [Putridiphycobacter roseus]|uniref:chorismate mutase n=1 Tax=Putridiphycobacter roseus TaxID=2219161 RepID=A0A2W1NJG4_9FLAO|nr:bifunctional 3-deoxy-7-phosphoheptulonate synthase/chorismate mutase type II [Putridiphycobacter roseus]PZE15762.1 3-deoxy-7-phosphoheptulonate synthase [Putridiphycobacter roseus]
MFKKTDKPYIIAGPCSVESEQQIDYIATALAKDGNTNLLRGGIWKPRTRPNTFEGVGSVGLAWLVAAGKKAKLPTATEVANAKHVEEALKAGIDVLWIGARTTVNPFSVQEIADAIQGTNIPIMIKNPITPDLDLWVGAIERIQGAGVTDIAAIHRGFSSYEKTKYRNVPNWGIPVGLMQAFPGLPIICDPSHIGGTRELILPISQKAMDMNMTGLMVEVHHEPNKALSDAQQQVTPANFKNILEKIIIRELTPNTGENSILENLRGKIDEIDADLLKNLIKRFEVIDAIGQFKKDNNMTILQVDRWSEILRTRTKFGLNNGLSEKFVEGILKSIHKESVARQTKILNKTKEIE